MSHCRRSGRFDQREGFECVDGRLHEHRHEPELGAVFLLEPLVVLRTEFLNRGHVRFVERGQRGGRDSAIRAVARRSACGSCVIGCRVSAMNAGACRNGVGFRGEEGRLGRGAVRSASVRPRCTANTSSFVIAAAGAGAGNFVAARQVDASATRMAGDRTGRCRPGERAVVSPVAASRLRCWPVQRLTRGATPRVAFRCVRSGRCFATTARPTCTTSPSFTQNLQHAGDWGGDLLRRLVGAQLEQRLVHFDVRPVRLQPAVQRPLARSTHPPAAPSSVRAASVSASVL